MSASAAIAQLGSVQRETTQFGTQIQHQDIGENRRSVLIGATGDWNTSAPGDSTIVN
jgi:hypothetical protein